MEKIMIFVHSNAHCNLPSVNSYQFFYASSKCILKWQLFQLEHIWGMSQIWFPAFIMIEADEVGYGDIILQFKY